MPWTTPPKYTKLWSHTSEELLSHLGHCWAKPAGAAPKGIIAPILRNGSSCTSLSAVWWKTAGRDVSWLRCRVGKRPPRQSREGLTGETEDSRVTKTKWKRGRSSGGTMNLLFSLTLANVCHAHKCFHGDRTVKGIFMWHEETRWMSTLNIWEK